MATRLSAHKDIERVLLSPRRLKGRVLALAKEIARDYAGKELVIVPVLQGGRFFAEDIVRNLKLPCRVEPIRVSSYDGTKTRSKVRLAQAPRLNLRGKEILIVEDIADSGTTLTFLERYFQDRGAAGFRTCVLLDKPSHRRSDVTIHYKGFTVPDAFVVGYGLDYRQRYRELPYIGVLKSEIYKADSTDFGRQAGMGYAAEEYA